MTHAQAALPPGPSLPSIVQLMRLLRRPHDFLIQCRNDFGDTFTLRLPGHPPMVITAEYNAVREQSVSGYEGPERYLEELHYLIGDDSVIFANGEFHRALRKVIVPPFHGERIRTYADEMLRVANLKLESWRVGELRLMSNEFRRITLDFIVRLVLGIRDETRLKRFADAYIRYITHMTKPWVLGVSMHLGGRRVSDYVRSYPSRSVSTHMRLIFGGAAANFHTITTMLDEEIEQCRRDIDGCATQRTDILAMFVAARLDDGSRLPDQSLKDQLMTLLLAGYESTANTLAWALYCLLRHRDALARVRAELHAVMGNGLDPARIRELIYLDACINESMRLYPVVPYLRRLLTAPLSVGAHVLPTGTVLGPSMFLVQRDPKVWSDPDVFRPERFTDGKPPVRQYFPFGLGVWRCLGAPFAELELRIVLARIVGGFRLVMQKPDQIRPAQVGVMVGPSHGLPVRIDEIYA